MQAFTLLLFILIKTSELYHCVEMHPTRQTGKSVTVCFRWLLLKVMALYILKASVQSANYNPRQLGTWQDVIICVTVRICPTVQSSTWSCTTTTPMKRPIRYATLKSETLRHYWQTFQYWKCPDNMNAMHSHPRLRCCR